MKLSEWHVQTIKQHTGDYADKVEQFGLTPLLQSETRLGSFTDIIEQLQYLGIWALQNPNPVLGAIRDRREFCALVGFRPSRFHLGHITLAHELAWYISRGAVPFFIVSGYEAGAALSGNEARARVSEFWQIVRAICGQELPEPYYVYSDKECLELRLMEDRVEEVVPIQKILQLYGWKSNISIAAVRVATMNAAAFLFPHSLLHGIPTIVLSDVKQVTHSEVAKIAARKLNIPIPAFSYRMLLPSLLGPQQRMSVKDMRSAIFLDEEVDTISKKLLRCFSGGCKTIEEQRENGGNPFTCSFFKICNLLLSCEDTSEMLSSCISGRMLCGQCKEKYVEPSLRSVVTVDHR